MDPFSLGAVFSSLAAFTALSGIARLRRRGAPKPTGLQTLVENQEAEVDFVCVHRLGGDSTEAWTTRSGPQRINWLKTLLPHDVPKARVLTYGYTSDLERSKYFQDTLYLQSSALLDQLVSKRPGSQGRRPIIFIAHGVGGLIVKTALIESSAAIVDKDIRLKSIQLSTVGVLYFGTPHQATQWTWDTVITRVVSLSLEPSNTSSKSLVQALAAQRDSLGLLFDRYKSIEALIKNYTFSEGLPTDLGRDREQPGKSEKLFVVPRQFEMQPSAGEWWINKTMPKSHEDLVKFGDREDADYKEVIKSISSCFEGFEKAQQRHDKYLQDLAALYVAPPKVQKKVKPRPQQLKPIEEPPPVAPSHVVTSSLAETETKYKETLAKYEEKYGLCDLKTLDFLDKFAQVYVDKADYECAEMIYKRILVAKQISDGPSSLSVARILTQIAAVAQEQGHHSEAEKCLRRAIEIDKVILGHDDHETIRASTSLAQVYNSEGRHEDAKRVYDDCKDKIKETKNAAKRSDEMTLNVLDGSAENLRNLGRNDEAAATYTTIIERRRSRSDSDSDPLLASTVIKLADTLEDMGKVSAMQEVLCRGPLPRMSQSRGSLDFSKSEPRPEGQEAKTAVLTTNRMANNK